MMKFKNELKRGFSMTVALAMCMGSLQVTALADDGENASGSDTASVSSDTAGNDAGAGESGAGESGAGESGAAESGADTDTGSNESSSTESKKETVSDTGRVEGETSTTTERDEEGRVTQEETTKTDSQTIITTETDTTITTETKTETDPEELGDREQTKTEQGKPETITDKVNSTSSEAVKDNLQVSFGVSAGDELNNVKDQLLEGEGGVVNKYEINKDGIVAGLKNDADKSKGDKETELETQGYTPVDGGWEKPILDNGKEVGKETVKVEVVEVKNDKGEIVGYKTVKTTTTTKYGEYNVTEDTTKGQELSFERPEEAESSKEGSISDVKFDENHTSEVVPETVPEGATAITDENGNTIGYTIETTIETTDPETGVTTTETRNEDVYFQVTETEVIGKTEKTDTEVFVSEDKIEGTVTETREDTVTVETITDEYILDVSQDTLDVTLGMDTVTEVDGTNDHNGFTVRVDNSNDEVASWVDKKVLDLVGKVKDEFSKDEFNEACIAGANINVTQNVCDSNGYKGTLELNFKFNQNQLDNGIFRLEVTDGNETKRYQIGKNEMNQYCEGFKVNPDGTQTFTLGEVGSSSNITIRLVGKMSMGDFDVTYGDGTQSKIGVDQYFNYETKIKVDIKEAKAGVKAKETEKTEGRKDTLTFERDKTITGTRTETVTTKTEVTTTKTVNSWRTDSSSSYTYASAPVPAPDPTPTTPGDGPANNNTNNVVVADPDVPLAEIPETEVPLAEIPDMEVPLADAPVEMDIPDEAVPMADVPAEVVIVDDAVPLADVPKTGDTSDIWYAAAVLSLGGWMLVSGRKREEEDA